MLRSNLPAQRVRLIGRGAELAAISRGLREARIVTVTGTGGLGKSVLAQEAAWCERERFADGAWWVNLDHASTRDDMLAMMTVAVGAPDADAHLRPRALAAAIGDTEALFVLDGCEHLVAEAAAAVNELVDSCPRLAFLVTSRIPLGIRGESLLRLGPLALPPSNGTPEALAISPCVALFLDRAQAAGYAVDPSRHTVETIGAICTALDGMPLAIELAAAFTPTQSIDEILQMFQPRRTVSEEEPPLREWALSPLRAAFDRSYDLLAPEDQRTFDWLSVFAGTWDMAAVEDFARAMAAEAGTLSRSLVRIVDQSLAARAGSAGNVARFRLLTPLRDYGAEKLGARAESAAAARAHARRYLRRAEQMTAAFLEPLTPAQIDEFNADRHNYEAALRWARDHRDAGVALRLATALWRYWRVRGFLHTGREHCANALAIEGEADGRLRAAVMLALADFEQLLGAHADARTRAEHALGVFRIAADLRGICTALSLLGDIATGQGDEPAAERWFQEGLATGRGVPNAFAECWFTAKLGLMAYHAGRFEAAGELLRAACATLNPTEGSWFGGMLFVTLGSIARQLGDGETATTSIRSGLSWLRGFLPGDELALGLEELAGVEAGRGDLERGAVLLGAAAAIREAYRVAATPAQQRESDTVRDRVRSAMGAERFAAAWVRGRALPAESAIDVAVSGDEGARSVGGSALDSLTRRESEVAALIAEGHSNAGIARELTISEATARTHVERVLGKLGVRSRVQVARIVLLDARSGQEDT